MSLVAIAELIPAEYRREILEMNMIATAKGQNTDPTMMYLCTIWKDYVEPDFTADCNLCCGRVLNNLKQMQQVLIDLEKQSKLLEQV